MRRILLVMITLSSAALAEEEPSTYDKVWDVMKLYENDQRAVIQSVALKGRIQGDAVSFHSEDASYEDALWRRFRFGFKAGLFSDFVIHSEMDLDLNEIDSGDWETFYKRLTDTYIGWEASDAFKLKVGKHSTPFTLDGATSSTKLLVPERSVVAENMWFTTEYFTGIGGYGDAGPWTWRAGGYSASGEPELGHFDSGYFFLLSGGHIVGENGSLRVDYVYNDPDYTGEYEPGTADLEHVLSLVYKQQMKRLGFWSDVTVAKGLDGQSDLAGIELMPFYDLSRQFQLVGQYAGVVSLDSQSDVELARYASKAVDGQMAEATHNLLLGFNWFLYGHKLKWQNAVEYNHGSNLAGTGSDYNGYGFTSALRISW